MLLYLTTISARDACINDRRYARFEHENGDMESITRVERRRRKALGDASEAASEVAGLLLSRYMFADLKPCDEGQRKHFESLGGLAGALAQGLRMPNGSTDVNIALLQQQKRQNRAGSSSSETYQEGQNNNQQQQNQHQEAHPKHQQSNGITAPAKSEGLSSILSNAVSKSNSSMSITLEAFLQQLPPASKVQLPMMAPEEILRAAIGADLSEDAERATDAALAALRGNTKNESSKKRQRTDSSTLDGSDDAGNRTKKQGREITEKPTGGLTSSNIFLKRHSA